MEQNTNNSTLHIDECKTIENVDALTQIVWGSNLKEENFERWSQGFLFDSIEKTALLQLNGGPCAIIVAVQAFLLKELLQSAKLRDLDWRAISDEDLNTHFTNSLLSIFLNVSNVDDSKYMVIYEDNESVETSDNKKSLDDENLSENSSPKRVKLDANSFKNRLKVLKCDDINYFKRNLSNKIDTFKKKFGIICFLYSIVLSKGIDLIRSELEESGDPLIDPIHGHGNQSLINLMMCGIATCNVFDGDRSLEGLTLHGIPSQSTIGFLTIMEYLRYCEVGWHLKNPKYPIWILASETHLTVLFSKETFLVQSNESPRQHAIKCFNQIDSDKNGFIKTDDLQNLMKALDLVDEKEYVDIVKQQLDSESLGIITQLSFLNEFYPEHQPQDSNSTRNKFKVYHYNGLPRSNTNNQVQFVEGEAELVDFCDQVGTDLNSIKSCLQTKWPTMEIKWKDGCCVPSLN